MRASALRIFHDALLRESHRIASRPGIVWQQLYNRLQWESAVAGPLEVEYVKRTAPDRGPGSERASPSVNRIT